MNTFERLEARLDKGLEALVTLCFAAIFLLTVTLVTLRYGFNSSIIGGNEAMNYLFIYTTALGAAVSIGKGTHIRIPVVLERLPEPARRAVMIVNYVLVGAFNVMMIVYSVPWIRSTGSFESPVMRIPNWIVQAAVPLGCGLAALYCLLGVVKELQGRCVVCGREG